jgi:hypothetical protein
VPGTETGAMRVLFFTYLALIAGGLALYIVVGLTNH